MRKITKRSVLAFLQGRDWMSGNMHISTYTLSEGPQTCMYLHGNMIAKIEGTAVSGTLTLFDAGWQSATTKERLNGILYTLNLPQISSHDGQWQIDGCDWTGAERIQLEGGRAYFG